jgi:hypothetical protein
LSLGRARQEMARYLRQRPASLRHRGLARRVTNICQPKWAIAERFRNEAAFSSISWKRDDPSADTQRRNRKAASRPTPSSYIPSCPALDGSIACRRQRRRGQGCDMKIVPRMPQLLKQRRGGRLRSRVLIATVALLIFQAPLAGPRFTALCGRQRCDRTGCPAYDASGQGYNGAAR